MSTDGGKTEEENCESCLSEKLYVASINVDCRARVQYFAMVARVISPVLNINSSWGVVPV